MPGSGRMTSDRRNFLLGSAAGALVALVAFAWLVVQGRADVLVREPYGNFYDAQAQALLHGHWNVPAAELFLEGFRIGGKTYTYFGPWPSVLRMPVIELAPSLYGRLTQVSLLLAFAVAMVGVIGLNWRIRSILRPEATAHTADTVVAFAVPIIFGIGSSAFFLGSRAWVYHEAILWGAAWALVGFERLLAFMQRPTGWRLAAASVAATLAFSSRGAVGLGPVVGLALVVGGLAVQWFRGRMTRPEAEGPGRSARFLDRFDWLGPRDVAPARRIQWLVAGVVAVVVPVGVYIYVNWARFGSLTNVPWTAQVYAQIHSKNRVLDANGGSYFNVNVAPTTLLQYLRPDALSLNRLFPWISFQHFRTPVIGGAVVDALDYATSIPASMPGITVLAVVGGVAVVSTRFARSTGARMLRVPIIGAAVGVVPTVTIAFVAQRYLGDFLPLVVIGALAGGHTLLHRVETSGPVRRRTRVVAGVLVVLLAFGVWANGSLAYVYGRLYNPYPETLRAGTIGVQYAVDRTVGDGTNQLLLSPTLPRRVAQADTTAIVGACDAMFWSDGRSWHLVQGTPRQGVFRIRADLPPADGAWHPMVTWGPPGTETVLGAHRVGNRIQVGRSFRQPDGTLAFNRLELFLAVDPHRHHDFDVVASPAIGIFTVQIDGRIAVAEDHVRRLPSGSFTVGRAGDAGVAAEYGAPIRRRPAAVGVCRQILPSGRAETQAGGSSSKRN